VGSRGPRARCDQCRWRASISSDQEAKVQPLIDQARPQIIAIHKDAMQKTQAVIDNTMSQIRPLLTQDSRRNSTTCKKPARTSARRSKNFTPLSRNN